MLVNLKMINIMAKELSFADGNKYVGEFKDSIRDGQGTYNGQWR